MVTALFNQEISHLEAQIAAFKEAESIATSGLEALSTAVDKVKQQLAPERISTLKETLKEAILDLFPSDSSIPVTPESSWLTSDQFTLWVDDSQKVNVKYHAGEPGDLTHHFEFFGPISETGYRSDFVAQTLAQKHPTPADYAQEQANKLHGEWMKKLERTPKHDFQRGDKVRVVKGTTEGLTTEVTYLTYGTKHCIATQQGHYAPNELEKVTDSESISTQESTQPITEVSLADESCDRTQSAQTDVTEAQPYIELVKLADAVAYLKVRETGEIKATYLGFKNKARALRWGQWLTLSTVIGCGFELRENPKHLKNWKYELKVIGMQISSINRLVSCDLTKNPPGDYGEAPMRQPIPAPKPPTGYRVRVNLNEVWVGESEDEARAKFLLACNGDAKQVTLVSPDWKILERKQPIDPKPTAQSTPSLPVQFLSDEEAIAAGEKAKADLGLAPVEVAKKGSRVRIKASKLEAEVSVATEKGGIVITSEGNRWVLWSDCEIIERAN